MTSGERSWAGCCADDVATVARITARNKTTLRSRICLLIWRDYISARVYAVPMAVVVQKYGGSSVADVNKLKRVAERVMRTRQQGHDVVVVVSAMGDTTDDLLATAKQVSPNPARRELDMLLSAG